MKYIFCIISIITFLKTKAQTYNSNTTIIVKSNFLRHCYINKKDSILLDSLNKVNYLNIKITEPLRLSIHNPTTKQYLYFFVEAGKHTIYINLDKSTIFSKTSKIAIESAEVWKIKKHYDTLIENTYLKNDGLSTNNPTKLDTVRYDYHKTYNNWCIAHPESFISLSFCESNAQHWKETTLNKEEINALFNVLDISLKKYPSYQKCKFFMDNYINNTKMKIEYDSLNHIIKPLWIPK